MNPNFFQKILEEEAACTGRPDISSNYVSNRDRIPVAERDLPTRDFDKELRERRLTNPTRADEEAQCTFNPEINRKSNRTNRDVDDLLRWGDEKRLKMASRRMARFADDNAQNTFTPEIDGKSRKMARGRNGQVEDRLIQSGLDRNKKVESMISAENKNMFRPKISDKSRQLARGKQDDNLCKLDNGKTNNLDFYEAIPKSAGQATLRRKPGQCTHDEQLHMIYRCGAEDEFHKQFKRSPNARDPL